MILRVLASLMAKASLAGRNGRSTAPPLNPVGNFVHSHQKRSEINGKNDAMGHLRTHCTAKKRRGEPESRADCCTAAAFWAALRQAMRLPAALGREPIEPNSTISVDREFPSPGRSSP